jgi:outer membrane cobalamin receptor
VQAWDRGSAAGKIQYTNIRPYFRLISQEVDWKKAPAALEGVAAFRQRVGKQGMLKFYGNFTQTDFSLYAHDIDDYSLRSLYDLTNRYRYINGTYKTALSKDWSIRSGVSYNFIENDVKIDDTKAIETEAGTHVKFVVEGSLRENTELTVGVETINREYSQRLADISGWNERGFTENLTSVFAEMDFFLSNSFVIRGGARSEHNSLTGEIVVDPRISMAYKTGDASQVSLAIGQFHQTPKNEWTRIDAELKPEKAQHYIINYQRIEDKKTFRIEAYYKRYDDLVKFAIDDESINNDGYGYAKGIELFWRDNATVPRLDYWISYSFLDTERDYLHFPEKATPYFASRHNASAVGKYFVQRLKSQVGITYSVTSGRPYHDPNKPGFNSSKTPVYTDLSINWSYLPSPQVIVYLSCSNVLGRDNIFGYEYSHVENEDGYFNRRPIRQAAPRFLFLGVFITLSKNKTMNQLPSL